MRAGGNARVLHSLLQLSQTPFNLGPRSVYLSALHIHDARL